MKRIILAAVVLLCAALSACATSYQPMGDGGGYLQRQLDSDLFLVSFRGNQHTSYDRARDLALLRAAEIGERLGYSYFSVEGRGDDTLHQPNGSSTFVSTTQDVKKTQSGTSTTETTAAFTNDTPTTEPGVNLWVRYYKAKPQTPILELHEVAQTAATLRAQYGVERSQS